MTTAFPALGTTAELVVTDPARLRWAVAALREELAAIDAACSRFRADSEVSRLHERAGRQVRVGPLLAEALGAALRAARLTDGLVDPTVGAAVRALGYDRDFALVAGDRDSGGAGVAGDRESAGAGVAGARHPDGGGGAGGGDSGDAGVAGGRHSDRGGRAGGGDSGGFGFVGDRDSGGFGGAGGGDSRGAGLAGGRHPDGPGLSAGPHSGGAGFAGARHPDGLGLSAAWHSGGSGRAGDRHPASADPLESGTGAFHGDPADAAHRRTATATATTPAPPVPAPGWHRILFDPVQRLVVLPRGVHLDLGATAKALAADRAARRIHATVGCGTLVNLGGDLRAAGPPPPGGWVIALGDDHAEAVTRPDATVALHRDGALATSGTTRRRWRHDGRTVHHIVDPRTGDVAEARWRTVTVVAKSTVDANTASTAAIVLGAQAPGWLAQRHLPARLVGVDGEVVTTPGWPGERDVA